MQKSSWKETGGFPNRDIYIRLNFLYQAAHFHLKMNNPNVDMVRYYCHTMKAISRKLVLRLDPNIKRSICTQCHLLLIPGLTSTVRTRSKPQRCRIIRCTECGASRRFLCRDNYGHHIENSNSTS